MSIHTITRPRIYRSATLYLGLLLALAACGGGADASTTTAAPAAGSSPPASSSGFTVKDLVGSWDNGVYVLTVTDGTEYTVAASDAPDVELMGGFVAAMGSTVSFATATTGECPAQTGNYKASLEGDTLTFTVSNDPCDTRAAGFTEPFTRSG